MSANEKQLGHDLIERVAPSQVSVVVHLLQVINDPVSRSLSSAPLDDEAISEEETRFVEASKAWLKGHAPTPHGQVLAEFGLTPEDFER